MYLQFFQFLNDAFGSTSTTIYRYRVPTLFNIIDMGGNAFWCAGSRLAPMTMADHDDSTISSEAVVGSSDMATQVCSP
jgi:hypothetical protein